MSNLQASFYNLDASDQTPLSRTLTPTRTLAHLATEKKYNSICRHNLNDKSRRTVQVLKYKILLIFTLVNVWGVHWCWMLTTTLLLSYTWEVKIIMSYLNIDCIVFLIQKLTNAIVCASAENCFFIILPINFINLILGKCSASWLTINDTVTKALRYIS